MDNNGRIHKVLIEDYTYTDKETGVKVVCGRNFIVWAKMGQLKKIILEVAGVYSGNGLGTYYLLEVDPRYDFEFVKKEVEAVLMCA